VKRMAKGAAVAFIRFKEVSLNAEEAEIAINAHAQRYGNGGRSPIPPEPTFNGLMIRS